MTKRDLAFLVSRILGPLPMAVLAWLVTATKSGIGFYKALWVYPLIFVGSIGLPFLITTYLVVSKRVSNIEWSKVEERVYLLPIIAIGSGHLLITTYFLTNDTIFHLSLLLSFIIFSITAVSVITKFKISGHVMMAAITISGINLFYHQKFLWLYLLLIPIAWARYTLKVHTIRELVAGLIITHGIIFLALLLFGWPNVP